MAISVGKSLRWSWCVVWNTQCKQNKGFKEREGAVEIRWRLIPGTSAAVYPSFAFILAELVRNLSGDLNSVDENEKLSIN